MSTLLEGGRDEHNTAYYTEEMDTPLYVVAKEGAKVVLRSGDGIELIAEERSLFEDGRTVPIGRIRATPNDYDRRLALMWAKHARQELRRLWNLYKAQLPLFYRCRQRISEDEALASAWTPLHVVLLGGIRLGQLIRAWQEPSFSDVCPACGGAALVYSFSGSPLSGMSSHSLFCPSCGARKQSIASGRFGSFMRSMQHIVREYPASASPLQALTLDKAISALESSRII